MIWNRFPRFGHISVSLFSSLSLLSQGDPNPSLNLLGHFHPGGGVLGRYSTNLILELSIVMVLTNRISLAISRQRYRDDKTQTHK